MAPRGWRSYLIDSPRQQGCTGISLLKKSFEVVLLEVMERGIS